jgi:RHS repeat-associated protein
MVPDTISAPCVNAQETYQCNNRLQPVMIELGTTSNATADHCLVYNYYSDEGNPTSCATPSQGSKNNGNVMGYLYQDSVNSSYSHTASFTYDGVNRLSTAAATGNSTYNLTFSYDPYGNMTCTTNGQTQGYCPNWAFNASTNQLTTSGFTYDAAGNLTEDSSNATAHTYQWDAEGRVASVDSGSTWGFTYDAVGDRVQWAYSGGANQQLFDPAGGWLGNAGQYSLVRWGDGPLAVYTGSETYFNHINHLSSTTAMTNHAGTPVEDVLFYPWGDVWQLSGSGSYNFAELPYYDTTTNTSLTPFRLQSPNLGRWMSPDPLGGDITNPQSLNRYAYVMNNPTTFIDPLGLLLPVLPCDDVFDPECAGGDEGGGDYWGDQFGPSTQYCPDPLDLTCFTFYLPILPPIFGGGGGGSGAPGGTAGTPGGIGNAGFPQSGFPGPWQIGWPNMGQYPCDFGICVPILNPYTLQIGGAFNLNIWIFSFNFAGGFAIDSHGHIATYTSQGGGPATGGAGSIGLQGAISTGATVCDLGGPFGNVSGTFGAGGSVSAEVFYGNSPHGPVRGGGVTAGAGVGGSGSVSVTATKVTPLGSPPCQ